MQTIFLAQSYRNMLFHGDKSSPILSGRTEMATATNSVRSSQSARPIYIRFVRYYVYLNYAQCIVQIQRTIFVLSNTIGSIVLTAHWSAAVRLSDAQEGVRRGELCVLVKEVCEARVKVSGAHRGAPRGGQGGGRLVSQAVLGCDALQWNKV